MGKFHINPATGNAGACKAKVKCRFGDLEKDHFATKEQAQQASERIMKTSVLKEHEAELVRDRENLAEILNNAWTRVPGHRGIGVSFEMNIPREEYNKTREELYSKGLKLDQVRKELRETAIKPYHPDFPAAINLEDAQDELMLRINQAPDIGIESDEDRYYFAKDIENHWKETMGRYVEGEDVKEDSNTVTPGDRLLLALTDDNNGIMGTGQLYAALVFPEKDLKPVLARLGVEDVSVAPFYNTREWGLAYTVFTPTGDTRSFSVYEHRNSDSLIINGETNWSREENSFGPYGDETRNKHAFFAEFAPDDKRQLAETLGYFLKEAQKGELDDDNTLAAKADHRDWNAILSEQIPAFGEWLKENGVEKQKRWFED